jgi:hypothetical protein
MGASEEGTGSSTRELWFLSLDWTVVSSLLAWTMANLLDVFSVWAMVRTGGRLAWARQHPVEGFVIYALLRLLVALAIALGVTSAGRRWPGSARAAWGALTLCALVTAATAWWRLYRG